MAGRNKILEIDIQSFAGGLMEGLSDKLGKELVVFRARRKESNQINITLYIEDRMG